MQQLEKVVSRLETVAAKLENLGQGKPQLAPKPANLIGAPSTQAPPHVRAYDVALGDTIENWSSISDQIGGDVKIMREKVTAVLNDLRYFLWTAAGRVEPSVDEIQKLFSPMVDHISEINKFKDSRRQAPQFNQLCAVAEGIPAVGWVLVKKTPAAHVKEMLDSSMFYINRVLKEFKEGDQKNVEWARLWRSLLEAMQLFVRQTHTTGLVWNSSPGCSPPPNDDRSTMSRGVTGAPAPPPPPPPPPGLFSADNVTTSDSAKAGRDALFAEINKGEAVTAGLRKVTAEMQTHKNPALRKHTPEPPVSHGGNRVSHEHPPSTTATVSSSRAPCLELKGGKQWNVEFMVNDPNVVVNVTDKKQTVYIYKCEGSMIAVKGKANSITLDSCRKTSVVFDGVVGQCETINCQRIEIQTLGEMPTISIQKTDGCQVYLSEASTNAEIVTSKSSEMNVLIPKGNGDYIELPIPEQFKTTYDGSKLVTCVSDTF
nr:Adenylate cyclase-associated CAP domain containing protein [Haemonchus contortus]